MSLNLSFNNMILRICFIMILVIYYWEIISYYHRAKLCDKDDWLHSHVVAYLIVWKRQSIMLLTWELNTKKLLQSERGVSLASRVWIREHVLRRSAIKTADGFKLDNTYAVSNLCKQVMLYYWIKKKKHYLLVVTSSCMLL